MVPIGSQVLDSEMIDPLARIYTNDWDQNHDGPIPQSIAPPFEPGTYPWRAIFANKYERKVGISLQELIS